MTPNRLFANATLRRAVARGCFALLRLGLSAELIRPPARTSRLPYIKAIRAIQATFYSRKVLLLLPNDQANPYNPHSRA